MPQTDVSYTTTRPTLSAPANSEEKSRARPTFPTADRRNSVTWIEVQCSQSAPVLPLWLLGFFPSEHDEIEWRPAEVAQLAKALRC